MAGNCRDLDFSWSLLDSRLREHFKNHQKKTRGSLFSNPSKQDIEKEFDILHGKVEYYYPELKGKSYQWMITNIGVFLRIVD